MRRSLLGLRATAATSLVVATVSIAALATSCGDGNPGFDPPANELAFPSGLMLDPRVSTEPSGPCITDDDCEGDQLCGGGDQCREPARWLFAINANSDRRFNAGSMLALDLDRFWEAAFGDPSAILSAGAALSPDSDAYNWAEDSGVCGSSGAQAKAKQGQWCRRVANTPQMVECLEEPFVCSESTVHFGTFPGPAAAWDVDPSDNEAMLLIPVRGDPSVTYVEISGTGDDLRLDCGSDPGHDGSRYCDDDHRLRFLDNDPELTRLAREPFRVLVSPQPDLPLAYVSHQGDPDFTLLALEGIDSDEIQRPAIVHQANLLVIDGASLAYQGGFGLAQRPCDVDSGNAPSRTNGCSRPLVYSALRWTPYVNVMTAITHPQVPDADASEAACVPDDDADISCVPQAEPVKDFAVGALSTANVPLSTSRPILADVAFSRTGNELYVLQSNPGGLLRIDTSIGPDGETIDLPAGQVEVCSQPTTLAVYDDGDNEYGLVTCYRSGELFVVDLASLTVVGLSRAGIGPDTMTVDLAREVVYIANTLDATISVIEMDPDSPARFTQIARLGLQEPYVQ
ncbi:hypothetical protein ENSA5_00080 [Enhygromyxa salina]|uniref:Uncharacterized protein n=1 Tax=Enhygromyxa salina TaxID=215803 RepID=A0A2S9YLB2_9BACT|nr:hypothetical protein [Enhygromyxa salina]PRQ05897.1 hypothetical protein ENSA5_00080 [Enhygromyxa salina]